MKALTRAVLAAATSALAILSAHAVAASLDFDGDGKSDILWRNAVTGESYLYPMSGTTILATEGYLRTVPLEWSVVGIGDFNGDGKADLLWRNSVTGQNYLYLMQGTTILAEGYIRTASLEWRVAGVGDFNGDARADVLWRNTVTGENYIYFLDGTTILASEGYIRSVPLGWNVVGVGDFNGDGKADILWRDSPSGYNYIYPMNGLTILGSEGYIRTVADTNWQVKGVADFNGDGRADILWRNAATGENYLYPMNGLAILGGEGYVRPVSDLAWQIVATGDYDGDGKADIFWRNVSTGENYLYPMNGTTIKPTEGFIRTVADLSWLPTPANAVDSYAGLDVGSPLIPGLTSVVAPGSAYNVTAAGSDIYATSDQFHFTHKAHSGDFDLRVRVASLTAVHQWSKAGLMARESLSADSRQVSMFATPAGGYEFQYRATTGAFAQKLDSVAQVSYPNSWVRLQRAGNVFTSYTSADAVDWTQLGTTTLALPGTVFLGMAVTSHDGTQVTLAQFRDLGMIAALPDTVAPSIPAALTAVASLPPQVRVTWNAATDNIGVAGYNVRRNDVLVGGTSALSYTDTGLAPSTTYSYTVTAADAAGNVSAPSAPLSVTTPAPAAPDLVVTSISYSSATGTFTSTVKNQGTAATPAGLAIGVAYSVDGVYRTWGGYYGSLAAGASVTIGSDGGTYAIPAGTHTIMGHVDDALRIAESNENNNQLINTITVNPPPPPPPPPPGQAQRPAYNTGTGFFVLGKTLYDADGYEFRIRGVNKVHYDSIQYNIVNSMKANAVRWKMYDPANTMPAQVAAANAWITRDIVPIPGNWDGTCNTSAATLTSIVDLWVARAASWTTSDFQRYAIINIANEWGPDNSVVWRDSYITAITRMRNAGYKQTLMIDAGGCGQDAADILKYAQAVFNSDPQKNVIFGLHIYGLWARPATTSWQQDYDTLLEQMSQLNVPIVIGEFGPGNNIGPSPTPITPLEIMTTAEGYNWGWLAWAADDNNLSNGMGNDSWFAMLYNNVVYNSSVDLTNFGKVVVDNAAYGLKAKAVKAVALTGTPPP